MQKSGAYRLQSSIGFTSISRTPHYSPFGSLIPNRSWSDASRVYRYGFNGKEKDFETANDNFPIAIGIGARIYDGRLGRWLSLDPLGSEFPNLSSYSYCANVPILLIDILGLKIINPYERLVQETESSLNAVNIEIFKLLEKYHGAIKRKNFKKNSSGGDWKQDWKLFKKLSNEKSDLEKTLKLYKLRKAQVENLIKNWKEGWPKMFKIMNNLSQNISIFIDDLGSKTNGETYREFRVVNDKIVGYGDVEITLSDRLFDDFSDKITQQALKTLRHEMGHAFELTRNAVNYAKYLTELYGSADNYIKMSNEGIDLTQDGHKDDDPSGLRADEWASYDIEPEKYDLVTPKK
ncbi:MAG: RHS repeat-associated core domain-containing protein [Bacteroidetes bacterium]|nr:RHS repeat-associated core domain-containing protein [Bacteroidota bacterium]